MSWLCCVVTYLAIGVCVAGGLEVVMRHRYPHGSKELPPIGWRLALTAVLQWPLTLRCILRATIAQRFR